MPHLQAVVVCSRAYLFQENNGRPTQSGCIPCGVVLADLLGPPAPEAAHRGLRGSIMGGGVPQPSLATAGGRVTLCVFNGSPFWLSPLQFPLRMSRDAPPSSDGGVFPIWESATRFASEVAIVWHPPLDF